MFPSFFETMFWAAFVMSLTFIVLWWIVLFVRMTRGREGVQGQTNSKIQPVIKEKEVIREIVKIRCSYCGNLYDEKLDKCPHCGGKKT